MLDEPFPAPSCRDDTVGGGSRSACCADIRLVTHCPSRIAVAFLLFWCPHVGRGSRRGLLS